MKPEIELPRPPRLSLRARFALGLAAVLLPFLLAGGVGQFYLLPRLLGPLEAIVYEVAEEIRPMIALEIALLNAKHAGDAYLIRSDPAAREVFARSIHRVEEAFVAASPERFAAEEERAAIRIARAGWRQARPLAEAILRLPDPIDGMAVAHGLQRFQAHLGGAVDLLVPLREQFNREIGKEHAEAQAAKRQVTFLIVVVLAAALGIALVVEALIASYVLRSVDALRSASRRVEEGDLAARVALEANDEFGELALAFNAMAEKNETDQRALEELAIRDGLTGLANRREFDRRLKEELERSRRYSLPFSLLMLDLDHFKAVNDTYGHPAGDEVLRTLAVRVRVQVRPVDQVARYGGEEFAVILPETDGAGALAFAERLRAAIAAVPFALHAERAIGLTASIGVASFPRDGDTERDLVAAADRALYSAKQSGRNWVRRSDG